MTSPSLLVFFALLVSPQPELTSQLLAQTPLPPMPSQTQPQLVPQQQLAPPQLAPQQQLSPPTAPQLGSEALTPPSQPQLAPQQRLAPVPQLAPPGQPALSPMAPANSQRDGGTNGASGATAQPGQRSTVRPDAGP